MRLLVTGGAGFIGSHDVRSVLNGAWGGTEPEPVTDRLGHDLCYSVGISRIAAELGYRPEVPFEQGLAETAQRYRDNRSWWEPLTARTSANG